jgi:hypothetical protein
MTFSRRQSRIRGGISEAEVPVGGSMTLGANQFGNMNNDAALAHDCPRCGAHLGEPCEVVDEHGVTMRTMAATHVVRKGGANA